MKRLMLALIAVLVAFVPSACEPVTGTVVGKDYDDPDTYYTHENHCTTVHTGKTSSRSCTSVPVQRYDPEHYKLVVRDKDGDEHKVDVDPGTYERAQEGDTWDGEKLVSAAEVTE